jgi:hypothetical protein
MFLSKGLPAWELRFRSAWLRCTAKTLDEARTLNAEAIEFHIEGMRLHGEHVPEPTTLAALVEAGRPYDFA